jgi:hypothetical protein
MHLVTPGASETPQTCISMTKPHRLGDAPAVFYHLMSHLWSMQNSHGLDMEDI